MNSSAIQFSGFLPERFEDLCFSTAALVSNYMEPDALEESVRSYAGALLSEATGGDALLMDRFRNLESFNENDLIRLLREAAVLREDLERVFQGEEPRYFISTRRIVELYRSRHGIHLPTQDPKLTGIRHVSEFFDAGLAEIERAIGEQETYGATLAEFRRGVACAAEQSFFYGTPEWLDRAKVVRVMDRFTLPQVWTADARLEGGREAPCTSRRTHLQRLL